MQNLFTKNFLAALLQNNSVFKVFVIELPKSFMNEIFMRERDINGLLAGNVGNGCSNIWRQSFLGLEKKSYAAT